MTAYFERRAGASGRLADRFALAVGGRCRSGNRCDARRAGLARALPASRAAVCPGPRLLGEPRRRHPGVEGLCTSRSDCVGASCPAGLRDRHPREHAPGSRDSGRSGTGSLARCSISAPGSGVLSLVARALGAPWVVAVEIDPVAALLAAQNQSSNDLGFALFAGRVSSLRHGARFDLALVNVIPKVIAADMPPIVERLAPEGKLIVSRFPERASRGLPPGAGAARPGTARAASPRRVERLSVAAQREWAPGVTTVFVTPEEWNGERVELDGSVHHHLFRVCRLTEGDPLRLADGAGRARMGVIERVTKSRAEVSLGTEVPGNEPAVEVHLLVVAPRKPRAEWLVEKTTELGVRTVRFVHSERGPRSFGAGSFQRLRRIARSAAEQCERARVPEITGMHEVGEVARLIEGLPAVYVLRSRGSALGSESSGRFHFSPGRTGRRVVGS